MADPTDDTGDGPLDAVIVGAGPAGLTAALYLARFRRRVLTVDGGDSRAAWIPTSHNIPFFEGGISGREILRRQGEHAQRYGAVIEPGRVDALEKREGVFVVRLQGGDGAVRELPARRVLLATGARDVEPAIPDLPAAVREGLIRYCPICDGYEAAGRSIAVLGHGEHGLGEAIFIARTYPSRVTLLTLGTDMVLDDAARRSLAEHDIAVIPAPIGAVETADGQVAAIRLRDGIEHRFDILYSALGLERRTRLALPLGAATDDQGSLTVDEHNQTSVRGLYAAGGVVRGLDQVVVAMGQAAVAATHIHNRCELPMEDEPAGPRAG